MRIVSGSLGGRIFASPHGHRTHPMSDKMRGALFNMLGDIRGLSVLDPFAGSGALCFEAVSRGSGRVVAVEQDKKAQRTITENIESLGLEGKVELFSAPAKGWFNRKRDTFDILLLDPPYDDLQYNLIEKLAERTVSGGRLVLSWPGGDRDLPRFPDYELLTNKQYGDASLRVYRRN